MKIKFKKIYSNKKLFLLRLTMYLRKGSFKIHLMLNDDTEFPHNHPWDFKTLLIIPYKEDIYEKNEDALIPYYDYEVLANSTNKQSFNHKPLTYLKRTKDHIHLTTLYKISKYKIPALSIGYYSDKKQLCNICQSLGYCKQTKTN